MSILKDLKLKRARRHHTKQLHKLFESMGRSKPKEDITSLIENRNIFVLKPRKKKVQAAFSFMKIGIGGICSFLLIRKLAVAPEQRGQGIGSKVIGLAKRYVQRKRMSGFLLYSLERAKPFYIKNKLTGLWRIFWWRAK